MSTDPSIETMLEESEALLKGHFLLSSGLHSNRYMQCAKLLQWPDRAERAARGIAERIRTAGAEVVVSPALGGVIIGQEVGRALGVRAIFTERVEGTMALRRGFEIRKGEKVLVVEDVVTTGKSTREVVALVEEQGGVVVGYASVVNRSGKENPFDRPYAALLSVDVPTWSAADCPLCREGSTPVKPGSRPKAS
jgi:orotate phosphoribosyltransferase